MKKSMCQWGFVVAVAAVVSGCCTVCHKEVNVPLDTVPAVVQSTSRAHMVDSHEGTPSHHARVGGALLAPCPPCWSARPVPAAPRRPLTAGLARPPQRQPSPRPHVRRWTYTDPKQPAAPAVTLVSMEPNAWP